ncbi:MAG: primosomal protein N' [Planctomycetes bacterium]|nr:primosomal protein N' [Planctomycetota bacterium]
MTTAEPTTETRFVSVALDLPLDRLYTYAVPQSLRSRIVPGLRVEVPFGRGNRSMVGYVAEVLDQCDLSEVKEVRGAVDDGPLIGPDLMDLARWMAHYYVTPLGQVLTAILPAAVKKQAGFKTVRLVVRGDKTEADVDRVLSKQQRILDRLDTLDNPVTPRELARMAGCTTAVIKALEQKGLVKIVTKQTEEFARDLYVPVESETLPDLSNEQRLALQRVKALIAKDEFGCVVVNGVTGSGKTEIYLRAIEQVVADGGQAIVLVPEIALTPQTIRRFRQRFTEVAVLHSHLTDVERHREWRDIRDGRAQVIVGARSAVFAPAGDLRLIVIDEEHETSFKQETAPRYHARDVALMRAHLLGIPVILGSATPSLESKHNCTAHDHYAETRLTARVMGRPMPPVEIVDLRLTAHERKGFHALSMALERAIAETLDRQEQVILFLNRRGFSTYVFCPSCGYTLRCTDCDVTMTFHRTANECRCHYCDRAVAPPEKCPACGSPSMNFFGMGTERLEEEVKHKFELARIARMDSDTMRSRGAHNNVLTAVRDRQVDILIGTQMIAKGLDFPNVTLVGVINADVSMNLPDFRASERTFQLISQVAGRAGRGPKGGRILVQTFNPDHEAVRLAAAHDYEGFAAAELEHRRNFGYPPFARLARIIVRGGNEDQVLGHCRDLALRLREVGQTVESGPIHVLGPAPCPITRINRQFRYQVLVKAPKARGIMDLFDRIRGTLAAPTDDLAMAVDIDPISTL